MRALYHHAPLSSALSTWEVPDPMSLCIMSVSLQVSPSGLVTITGGKWTTFRRMAEDTVDTVLKEVPHINDQGTARIISSSTLPAHCKDQCSLPAIWQQGFANTANTAQYDDVLAVYIL